MGLEDQLSGPADRLHDFVGRDATLTNAVIGGYDDYGDPIPDETNLDVRVEVSARGSGSFDRRLSGIDTNATAAIWVAAGVDVYDGSESDDRLPSTITVDGDEYQVLDVTVEETGRHRCLCDTL